MGEEKILYVFDWEFPVQNDKNRLLQRDFHLKQRKQAVCYRRAGRKAKCDLLNE